VVSRTIRDAPFRHCSIPVGWSQGGEFQGTLVSKISKTSAVVRTADVAEAAQDNIPVGVFCWTFTSYDADKSHKLMVTEAELVRLQLYDAAQIEFRWKRVATEGRGDSAEST
jgi:hypothetical protein